MLCSYMTPASFLPALLRYAWQNSDEMIPNDWLNIIKLTTILLQLPANEQPNDTKFIQ